MTSPSTKRIGIVDYHLDNFHANTYLAAVRGPLAGQGYVVAGATAWLPEPSRAWAERKNVRYFASVEQLAAEVDCFMVLAPSNPELHEEMCQQVLPLGKTTFVDKTFAPDVPTAQRIFALADECDVAIQTTSALRSTNVQKFLRDLSTPVRNLYVFAGGTTFSEYGIHPVELAVSCLGAEVNEMMRLGSDDHPLFVVRYQHDRTSVIDFSVGVDVPYAALIVTDETSHYLPVDLSTLFVDAMSEILDFFDAGRSLIPRSETMLVHRILDAARSSKFQNRFDPVHTSPALRTHSGTAINENGTLAIWEPQA